MKDPRGFYRVMGYPLPLDPSAFARGGNDDEGLSKTPTGHYASRDDQAMEDRLQRCRDVQSILASTPFLRAVYICNSVSFDAAKKESDIDIFCIADEGFLWFSRIWVMSLLWITGRKRTRKKNPANMFCTSFRCTPRGSKLFSLAQSPVDYYLIYWIAHLRPLYVREEADKDIVAKNNTRIHRFLIGMKGYRDEQDEGALRQGSLFFVPWLERFFSSRWMARSISLIRRVQIIIMTSKKNIRNESDTIISDTCIKTYRDKRSLYNIALKKALGLCI